jgi:tetratricopeptide (TPR) repeat protein
LHQGDAEKAVALARAGLDVAVATQAADYEVQTLLRLGEAELALGHHDAAAETFERAESVARATDVGGYHDAMAGLARVALAKEDMATALELVERLLVASTSPEGIEGAYARLVLFTCQQVLAHAGDSRAVELLESVHAELQTRAATISDDSLRRSFLDNVPLHREIVAAWSAHQSAPPGKA